MEDIKSEKGHQRDNEDVFGDVEWARGCFGIWMHRNAWSNTAVMLLKPGNIKKYDYSWNIDHIRPKSDF